jgi:hypothetical protein
MDETTIPRTTPSRADQAKRLVVWLAPAKALAVASAGDVRSAG